MRRQVKHVIKVLLMFALIMCWGISLGYANNIETKNKTINFYFEKEDVTVETVKSIEENQGDLAIVGWREKGLQSAYNPDLNRTVNNLNVLLINGNSSLLTKGPMLFKDDKEGCLIDKDTSYKLFGSIHGIGKEIVYNNRNLTVRGILSDTKSNIIVQLPDESVEVLDGLTIDGTDFTLNKINEFKTQFGIEEMAISGGVYYSLAKTIVMIFPIIALILIVIKIIISAIKSRNKPILILIYIAMVLVVGFIFLKITKVNISIPLDMIPNKWSDFDFWIKMWKENLEKLQYVLYMKKYGVDIYNIENLLMAILYSIFTIVLFIVNLKVIKISDIKTLIITTATLTIGTFISIVFIWSKFKFDVNATMLWAIYPLYLCADYFMNAHYKYMVYEEVKKEELKDDDKIEGAFC